MLIPKKDADAAAKVSLDSVPAVWVAARLTRLTGRPHMFGSATTGNSSTTGSSAKGSALLSPQTKASESSPLVREGGIVQAGALDDGGEVPLFTWRTIGALLLMGLSWVHRGATASMPLSVMTNYLHAPANMIAAFAAVVPSPFMFVMIPGLLSDCMPVCGSRRRSYCFVGLSVVFVAYLLLALLPFPQPYFCADVPGGADTPNATAGGGGLSGARAVCNPDAPKSADTIVALLTLAEVSCRPSPPHFPWALLTLPPLVPRVRWARPSLTPPSPASS